MKLDIPCILFTCSSYNKLLTIDIYSEGNTRIKYHKRSQISITDALRRDTSEK